MRSLTVRDHRMPTSRGRCGDCCAGCSPSNFAANPAVPTGRNDPTSERASFLRGGGACEGSSLLNQPSQDVPSQSEARPLPPEAH